MDFYEMIKKWTINDYYTPGIKVEVIIDMLLSEFIEDIVTSAIGKKAFLLAKEFPLNTDSNDLRNNKVDYLLGDENTIYLVELKTSDKSYKASQFESYNRASMKESITLYNDYKRIITKNLRKVTKKDTIEFIKGTKYSTTEASLVRGIENINQDISLEQYFNNKKVKLIYITPNGIKNNENLKGVASNIGIINTEKERKEGVFYLADVNIDPIKKDNWDKVLKILESIYIGV